MLEKDSSPTLLDRFILGGGVAATLSLAFQMNRPLDQLDTAPGWFNWISVFAFTLLLMRFLLRGKNDERWLSGLCLTGLWYFLGRCEPWSTMGSAEFSSRTAALLSTTFAGIGWLALVLVWLCLGVGLICGRAVLLCFPEVGPWPRACAWLLGLLVAAFGAHGVMGYASGNSSLLLP